jgi:hypothetical protein
MLGKSNNIIVNGENYVETFLKKVSAACDEVKDYQDADPL